MKTSVIVFIIACGVIAGAVVYLNRQKAPPTPALVADSAPQPSEQAPPENIPVPKPPTTTMKASETAPVAVAAPAVEETKSNDTTNSISKAVDALLAARSAAEKHTLFLQLAKDGQLDQVIAELKERAAANPNDPEIPTTLGEALLNKLRAAREAGDTDINDTGILAMQADQSFNAALKIDPKNWEANFVKAASQYYWPANPQMDNDVVQRLAGLIDQQETMPQEPEFVQPYIVLGNEYEKLGQHAEAVATWQLGAQKFPGNPDLQKLIAGASH
jgi:cytochrome c-type biogenesis protein CcmH/NrfG